MKTIKEVLVSLFQSLFISYVLMIGYFAFGPVFIDGQLAIYRINKYTLITWVVLFWPVYLIRRRRAKKRESEKYSRIG